MAWPGSNPADFVPFPQGPALLHQILNMFPHIFWPQLKGVSLVLFLPGVVRFQTVRTNNFSCHLQGYRLCCNNINIR